MIFSEAEMAEYESVALQTAKDADNGKKPSISSVLMSVQFAVVLKDENDAPWYENKAHRELLGLSVLKLMKEHEPGEFSVGEKALMIAVLQVAYLSEKHAK